MTDESSREELAALLGVPEAALPTLEPTAQDEADLAALIAEPSEAEQRLEAAILAVSAGSSSPLAQTAAALEARRRAKEDFFTAGEDPRVVALRDAVQELAFRIHLLVPAGRQRSLALTELEHVQMRANRGLFAPKGH